MIVWTACRKLWLTLESCSSILILGLTGQQAAGNRSGQLLLTYPDKPPELMVIHCDCRPRRAVLAQPGRSALQYVCQKLGRKVACTRTFQCSACSAMSEDLHKYDVELTEHIQESPMLC